MAYGRCSLRFILYMFVFIVYITVVFIVILHILNIFISKFYFITANYLDISFATFILLLYIYLYIAQICINACFRQWWPSTILHPLFTIGRKCVRLHFFYIYFTFPYVSQHCFTILLILTKCNFRSQVFQSLNLIIIKPQTFTSWGDNYAENLRS